MHLFLMKMPLKTPHSSQIPHSLAFIPVMTVLLMSWLFVFFWHKTYVIIHFIMDNIITHTCFTVKMDGKWMSYLSSFSQGACPVFNAVKGSPSVFRLSFSCLCLNCAPADPRLLQMSSLDIMWSSGKLTPRERPNGFSLLNIACFHFNLDCYSQLPGLIMNTNNNILIILLAWLISDDTRISLTMPFTCFHFFLS